MKIKLGQLERSREALGALAQLSLPIAAAFQIARRIDKISIELIEINKQKQALARRLGEIQEDGSLIIQPGEKLTEFNREVEKLLAVEVNLEIEPLNPDIFGEIEISPAILLAALYLFEPK